MDRDGGEGWEDTGRRLCCLGLFLPQPSPRLQVALLTGFGWEACHQQGKQQEFLPVLHRSVLSFCGPLEVRLQLGSLPVPSKVL